MSTLAWPGQLTHSHILSPREELTWHRLWSLPLAGAPSGGHPPGTASPSPGGLRSGHLRGLSYPGLGGSKPLLGSWLLPSSLHPQPALCCRGCRIWKSYPVHPPADSSPHQASRYWVTLPSSTPFIPGFPGGQQKGHPCPQRWLPASLAPSNPCLGISVTSPAAPSESSGWLAWQRTWAQPGQKLWGSALSGMGRGREHRGKQMSLPPGRNGSGLHRRPGRLQRAGLECGPSQPPGPTHPPQPCPCPAPACHAGGSSGWARSRWGLGR